MPLKKYVISSIEGKTDEFYKNLSAESFNDISVSEKPSEQDEDPDSKFNGIEIEYESVSNPPDGGWGWIIVVASFFNNFVFDGISFSYGELASEILRASNETVGEFEYHMCGSTMLGMTLLVGPVVSVLIPIVGYRALSIGGNTLAGLGFLLAWGVSPNVPNFWGFFFGFGLLTGIGFGLMFTTSIIIVGFYFEKNRPLATGIAVTGGAVGSMVFPFIIKSTIEQWGWQGCMITLAGFAFLTTFFSAFYSPVPMKVVEKVKSSRNQVIIPRSSQGVQVLQFLVSPTFVILSLSGGIFVLAYFVPSAFLADRSELSPFNATSSEAVWLTASIGMTNTIGRIVFGILANSDRAQYSLLFTNIAVTSGGLLTVASVYLTEYYQLLIYAAIMGLIIAVYASLRSIIVMDFLGEDRFNMGFGMSIFFMGIASLFGNSLAGGLKEATGDFDVSFQVAGGFLILSGVMCFPLKWIHDREVEAEQKSGRRKSIADVVRKLSTVV